MKFDEAKKLAKKLAGLFPVTEEQAKAAIHEFQQFDYAKVDAAIIEHRRTVEQYVNWPKLYEACKSTAVATADPHRPAFPDESFAKVIRKQRPDLAGASDTEVVLRYWRGQWFRYKQDADRRLASIMQAIQNGALRKRLEDRGVKPEQIAAAQEKVLALHEQQENGFRLKCQIGCEGTLREAGMDESALAGWVETIFADPGHFRNCLAELRGTLPAFAVGAA